MALFAWASGIGGAALIALGFVDVFFTILHSDRDGPLSKPLNRAIWVAFAAVARRWRSARREWAALAGPIMLLATLVLWMALFVVGFALIAWPHLETAFDAPPGFGDLGFLDALYWSGVTFTTLGYGDVTPVGGVWKMVAFAEAASGFALTSGAIAFILSVFSGVDHRDKMALRILSETGGTWSGRRFLLQCLGTEGTPCVRDRVESLAVEVRTLHERLYRFQPLAFYLRSRNPRHDPEPMLQGVAEVTLGIAVLAQHPEMRALQPVAEHLGIAYTEFARTAMRHHGSRSAQRLMERPVPTEGDLALLRELWLDLRKPLELSDIAWDAEEETRLLQLAARMRVFLAEVERLTCWRMLQGP